MPVQEDTCADGGDGDRVWDASRSQIRDAARDEESSDDYNGQ